MLRGEVREEVRRTGRSGRNVLFWLDIDMLLHARPVALPMSARSGVPDTPRHHGGDGSVWLSACLLSHEARLLKEHCLRGMASGAEVPIAEQCTTVMADSLVTRASAARQAVICKPQVRFSADNLDRQQRSVVR